MNAAQYNRRWYRERRREVLVVIGCRVRLDGTDVHVRAGGVAEHCG